MTYTRGAALFLFVPLEAVIKAVILMLRSCKYCGRIHDSMYICQARAAKIVDRRKYDSYHSEAAKLRRRERWKKMSVSIRERDGNLCQVCLREGLPWGDGKPVFTHEDLSVHHIVPIEVNPDLAFCGNNLVTLCFLHHQLAEDGTIPAAKLSAIAEEQEARARA